MPYVTIQLFVLSLVIILTEGGVSKHNPFYCYSKDPIRPQNVWFGVHTAYEPVRGHNINANVSTCNPSKFWMLSRHGINWPYIGELNSMLAMKRVHNDLLSYYDQGRTSLCASDIELLRNWQFDPNITPELTQYLSVAGWNDLEGIAQRYQAAFPSILPSTYSQTDYLFHSTGLQRTIFSLHAFADGLFGVDGHEDVEHEVIIGPDYLLRAYMLCPLYNETIANFPERDAFREGPEYQEMTSQVSAKLGFHKSYALRNDDVYALNLICRYEQIWHLNVTSPFCSAFSIANFQVIEYLEDLLYYYRMGPGRAEHRKLHENLVCFNMQEMLHFVLSNDPNDHKARIYTGHVNILPMMLLNFGVLETDDPPTQHNFAQHSTRQWKTGMIMPFAANLAIIPYDCADGDNDILFLYNEKPLQLPGCNANGVCKQSLIVERLGHWLDADCMEIYCRNS